MTNEVLNGAEDIVLIRLASNKDNFVYAVKPDFVFKKKHFDMTTSNSNEANVGAFGGCWAIDNSNQEIKGSSMFLGLRFDKTLRASGLWIPGVLEARVLDTKKKLTNGVYRDNGMAIYSASGENSKIAQSLTKRARKEGWEFPLLVPFRSLDYKINGKTDYGVDISFVENPIGLIRGKEAVKVLNRFNREENNGAYRLLRDDDGSWGADYGRLADSSDNGRVGDWICGEAARADLAKAYDSLSERKYGVKIRELEAAKKQETYLFGKELETK